MTKALQTNARRVSSRSQDGKYEITFEEWDACVASDGCSHKPDDKGWGRTGRPVVDVSWQDAQQYADWLSNLTGKSYRLPSEAEWEYSARAGTNTNYFWGGKPGKNLANCSGCDSQWDNVGTAPVGSFASNDFGLFDVHGNVAEWVMDVWHNTYENAPRGQSALRGKRCNSRTERRFLGLCPGILAFGESRLAVVFCTKCQHRLSYCQRSWEILAELNRHLRNPAMLC